MYLNHDTWVEGRVVESRRDPDPGRPHNHVELTVDLGTEYLTITTHDLMRSSWWIAGHPETASSDPGSGSDDEADPARRPRPEGTPPTTHHPAQAPSGRRARRPKQHGVADMAAIMAMTCAVCVSPISHPDVDVLINNRREADDSARRRRAHAETARKEARDEGRAARRRRQMSITELMGKKGPPD